MNKPEFLGEVLAEAKALRNHATKKEKEELEHSLLNPDSKYECIYGQMTGNCFSSRATELLRKCAKPIFEDLPESGTWSEAKKNLTTTGEFVVKQLPLTGPIRCYYSPIETYICLKDAKTKSLIKFIRGERKQFNP